MTHGQVTDLFLAELREYGFRKVERTHHVEDDVIEWSAEVFDPELPDGEDLVGWAVLQEHYGEVFVSWS